MVTYATKHNGGRTQVNFGDIGFGGEYPFIDVLKTSSNWAPADNTDASFTPNQLDANGYPNVLLYTGAKKGFFPPPSSAYSGNWVITWTGNGTIAPQFGRTDVSGSLTGSGGSGRYVFTPTSFLTGGQQFLAITALPVTNLKMFRADEETRLNSGEIFALDFLNKVAQGNFGVYRFLNWDHANFSTVTTWSSRKPQTYHSWVDSEKRASLYCGTTSNVSGAYTSGVPSIHSSDGTTWANGDVPKDKDTIIVLWNISGSSGSTLKVGSSGTAKTVESQYGSDGYSPGSGANAMDCLIYDATLDKWLASGGATGIANSVPYEVLVQLCAQLGAHPWFSMPWWALDPMTDFVTQLATYVRDNGPSWMVPRFEGPNELWNFVQPGVHYADNKATAYGWGSFAYHDWYGKIISTIGQAVSAVYSADRTRYQVICGVQVAYGTSAGNAATHNERMNSTKYVASTPQSGYTATAGKNWITHICPANYFTPADYKKPAEVGWAVAYHNGVTVVADQYCDTLLNPSDFSLHPSALPTLLSTWKTWAQGFGINKMTFYEGGYSPDYTGSAYTPIMAASQASQCVVTMDSGQFTQNPQFTNNSYLVGLYAKIVSFTNGGPIVGMTQLAGNTYQIVAVNGYNVTLNVNSTGFTAYTSGGGIQIFVDAGATITLDTWLNNLRSASKNSVALASYLSALYQSCISLSDATFTAEFPSCFQFGSASDNAWAMLEDIYVSPDPPQWITIKNWNSTKRATPLQMRLHS